MNLTWVICIHCVKIVNSLINCRVYYSPILNNFTQCNIKIYCMYYKNNNNKYLHDRREMSFLSSECDFYVHAIDFCGGIRRCHDITLVVQMLCCISWLPGIIFLFDVMWSDADAL